MKSKIILIILIFSIVSITSCESLIEFEKKRFTLFMYFFWGSLIIGILGFLFSDKNHNK